MQLEQRSLQELVRHVGETLAEQADRTREEIVDATSRDDGRLAVCRAAVDSHRATTRTALLIR